MGFDTRIAALLGVAAVILGDVAFLRWGVGAQQAPGAAALSDDVIHTYLMTHPVVLREMEEKLHQADIEGQQRKFQQTVKGLREELVKAEGDSSGGNPHGDITILEFYDVECPYCKALTPELERLVKEDQYVHFVYKEFPILGNGSELAARAEIASQRQGLYEPFHTALMADRTAEHELDEEHILAIARSVGLKIGELKRDMADRWVDEKISANKAVAAELAISGTPGLVFLGPQGKKDFLSPGSMTYDSMKSKLAELRLAAR